MDKLSYKFFRDLNITPNNYVFLYNVIVLKDTSITPLIHDLGKLEDAGYIKILAKDISYNFDYIMKDKAFNLFLPKELTSKELIDNMFLRFWNTFPVKVGNRVLKSRDIDSKEALEIKKKLIPYISKEGNFNKLMLGLDNELEIRKKDNSLQFMQMVSTYVNNFTWEKYYSLELESKTDTKEISI